ncbi:5-oxoprolinase subunit B family protein [Rhodococcoides kyotonense]|uniref:Sensor histidine kinase inhibitor, KipI family n=1 Tax=Rhodococcoides kyotonense TaxID=398843 RepID=A0A239IQ64_9NOCA|nr:carboxyltransferase domain-containing protein [Rhodococcus kyotonensis]SNS95699.1 sensor histidine kinase inhibitor, KipI family [Rhodococcus kyotonensis]
MITLEQMHRAGDRGWLVDMEPHVIPAWIAATRRSEWSALLQDLVPAAASILFIAHRSHDMPALEKHIQALLNDPSLTETTEQQHGRTTTIPVVYDGEDLSDVANALGISAQDVAAQHAAAVHTVGFFGFAPGFAYIDGCPDRLALPRRTSPRPKVAAGAIAIAGTQTVVYPGGTPGGWHIIGHTDVVLWNTEWDNPSRLTVGDRIVFERVNR